MLLSVALLLGGCSSDLAPKEAAPASSRIAEHDAASSFLLGGYRMDVADFDGDGDDDMVYLTAGWDGVTVAENDGAGGFSDVFTWEIDPGDIIGAVRWMDWNNDGLLDIVYGQEHIGDEIVQLLLSTGGVSWVASHSGAYTDHDAFVDNLDIGDCDGDGDDDIAVSNHGYDAYGYALGYSIIMYRNDGSAMTMVLDTYWFSDPPNDVAFGDFDADGDLDLAVATKDNRPVLLYENDGSCGFTEVWSSSAEEQNVAIAFVDLNGDGADDLFVANADGASHDVYLSNHVGFDLYWEAADVSDTTSIATADYDGDGDIDVAVGRSSGPPSDTDIIYVNRGDGSFVEGWTSDIAEYTYQIAFADLEGDGDLDLVTDHYRWYDNDGASIRVDSVDPGSAGVSNDVDVMGALAGASLRLVISASDSPTVAVPGCPALELEQGAPVWVSAVVNADPSGDATFAVSIPSAAAGQWAYLTVVDADSCAASSTFPTRL